MFESAIYQARRAQLKLRMKGGVVVLVGASEAARNFRDNPYHFVQDGSFSYFFGLLKPDFIGVIDLDSGEERLFGREHDLEAIVWHGDTPSLRDQADRIGVEKAGAYGEAAALVQRAVAQGRPIHFPPPYRGDTAAVLSAMLGVGVGELQGRASTELVRAIVALREIKGAEEISEMETALEITRDMHLEAMALTRPGAYEREIVAEFERLPRKRDWHIAYASIFSKRGEILHNYDHSHQLQVGDIVVNDSGAASGQGYASDITRTLPVGGRFTPRQRELYDIVFEAQEAAIRAVRPGAPFVDIHKLSMQVLAEGLIGLGLFKGDPGAVVESGAYALVCQGGLGHQIGLDVHDMESLGEDLVGYDEEVQRSPIFGMNRLRLGKRLKPGMTITVEPGLYFIPPLIDAWRRQGRHAEHINYEAFSAFLDAGGYRIEDDVLVTGDGARVLGPPVPRKADEVEAAMGR